MGGVQLQDSARLPLCFERKLPCNDCYFGESLTLCSLCLLCDLCDLKKSVTKTTDHKGRDVFWASPFRVLTSVFTSLLSNSFFPQPLITLKSGYRACFDIFATN